MIGPAGAGGAAWIIGHVTARVGEVDGVVVGIGIAVGADMGWLPTVWLDEEVEFWVVVAGVEILERRRPVIAFADEAFVFGWGRPYSIYLYVNCKSLWE